jgi:thiamine-phosphate pyrophosphorylase
MCAAVTDDGEARRRAMSRRLRGVYAITPELPHTHELVTRVDSALQGGACAIQYRNKQLSIDMRRAQAAALAPEVKRHGALFIVNDDADIAVEVDADGVHIGEDDEPITAVRARVGRERLIGVSCYNDFTRAEAAVAAGADYIAFGSFFASSVKPQARRAPIDLLSRARALDVPVVAIGGIDASNAGELAHAGADAIAVISAVFNAGDAVEIAQATRVLAGLMRQERTTHVARETRGEKR